MGIKNLKELTTGFPKEIMEYLETNTELAKIAIESHKANLKHNLLYIFIGFIFSISGTIAIELITESETESFNKQLYEINATENNQNIEFERIRLKIESLKNEVNSLKKK
jgi:hypothetical protein